MSEPDYADDVQFAGLVQAATAAADEHVKTTSRLGKRKRNEEDNGFDMNAAGAQAEPETAADDNLGLKLQNSAAVLFREPSAKSQKYSRPPLGKVYASLELAPEIFLKLQAAAKDFMLDAAHPERRDVVGHRRHSTGTDVAKLKLWNCVEQFLSLNDNGRKFFGPVVGDDIPGAPERTIFWPEDRQKVIRLLMPLMRKMVTNERQRVYAAETRKSSPFKGTVSDAAAEIERQPKPDDLTSVGVRDLDRHGSPETDLSRSEARNGTTAEVSKQRGDLISSPPFKGSVVIYVNLVINEAGKDRRLMPRFTLHAEEASNLSALLKQVGERFDARSHKDIDKETDLSSARVRVWLSDGLVRVKDDGEWMVALLSASTVDWMDGQVRVLIDS